MRFSRLRPVASRQFFFDMAIPSRGASVCRVRYRTVKYSSLLRLAFLKTRPNAAWSNKRFCRVNRAPRVGVSEELSFGATVTIRETGR